MDKRLEQIARFNYWGDNNFNNGVERKLYLDRVRPFMGNRLIKIITGQRRAGKSWLIRQIISSLINRENIHPHQILYINKEFYRYSFLRTPGDLISLFEAYKKEINPKDKVYLFLDEIHNVEGWENAVNSLSQDPGIDCEVFVTGSNSKMLSSELATLLSGRYIEFEVQPFSYSEYLRSTGNDIGNRSTMIEYLRQGGLPEFTNLNGEETKRNYVEALRNTILLKDIVERFKIKDVALLDRVFAYLLNNSCSLVSVNNIVNFLNNEFSKKGSKLKKMNYETISNYIGYLQDAYLVHKVERYDVKGKEILRGTAKYYANDNCYSNYLYEGYAYGQGALLESYVYQTLRRAGFVVYTGKMPTNEVDFVCFRHDRRLYVQSSWTMEDAQTAEREYRPLESVADSFPKIIVTMDDIPLKIRNGIVNVRAWDLEQWLGARQY